MSTLAEIEAAVDQLPPEEKQELLLFLAARLREERGSLPGTASDQKRVLGNSIAFFLVASANLFVLLHILPIFQRVYTKISPYTRP
jgi:hypothetical protein